MPSSNRLSVLSVNLGNPDHSYTVKSQASALARILAAAGRPEVVALQEALSGLKAPRDYVLVTVPGRGAEAVAFLVRKGLKITGAGGFMAHPGRIHGWLPRWVTWVTVDDVSVIDLHLNSHIEQGGRPRDARNERTTLAFSNIAQVATLAQDLERRGEVIVAGDTNVDAKADQAQRFYRFPTVRFEDVRLREVPVVSPRRRVDRAWTSRALADGASGRLLPGVIGLDHRPLLVTVVR